MKNPDETVAGDKAFYPPAFPWDALLQTASQWRWDNSYQGMCDTHGLIIQLADALHESERRNENLVAACIALDAEKAELRTLQRNQESLVASLKKKLAAIYASGMLDGP